VPKSCLGNGHHATTRHNPRPLNTAGVTPHPTYCTTPRHTTPHRTAPHLDAVHCTTQHNTTTPHLHRGLNYPTAGCRPPPCPCSSRTRLGTSVCHVTRDKKELDLTGPDRGCRLFLLSFGCDGSGYYRMAHGTALIPNETQCPCRTLVACLTWTGGLELGCHKFADHSAFPHSSCKRW